MAICDKGYCVCRGSMSKLPSAWLYVTRVYYIYVLSVYLTTEPKENNPIYTTQKKDKPFQYLRKQFLFPSADQCLKVSLLQVEPDIPVVPLVSSQHGMHTGSLGKIILKQHL